MADVDVPDVLPEPTLARYEPEVPQDTDGEDALVGVDAVIPGLPVGPVVTEAPLTPAPVQERDAPTPDALDAGEATAVFGTVNLPSRPTVLPITPPVTASALPTRPTVTSAPRAYESVGDLPAETLLRGRPDQFAHLDDRVQQVRDWVQDHLTNNGLAERVSQARQNPAEKVEMTQIIDRLILQFISKENVIRGEDRRILITLVINEILGLGPIEPLWTDSRITEVMVNGPNSVYAEIDGKLIFVPGCRFRNKEQLLEVCQQILAPLNRRLDHKNPLEDGRLSDGSRVNAVHYAIAPTGPLLTIRRFPETVWTMLDLVKNGSLDEAMAVELAWLVYYKCSTIIVGGTGSGKTSLLNALSSCIPRGDRVVTVEDSLELRLHPDSHVAAMEGRPPAPNGEGEITIRRLVKNALRMRPDRVVVGEVRDGSALDMLQAMNTGHEGSLTTVHANGAHEAINRLAVLVAQGGDIPEEKVSWLIGDALDLMVIQKRYEDGSRRVAGIYEVPSMNASKDGRLHPVPLWEWVQTATDDIGKFVGEYVKRNEISAELLKLRRLGNFERFSMSDVERMSELPVELQMGH